MKKYKLLLISIFCISVGYSQEQEGQAMLQSVLENVNRLKIANKNDSALYELFSYNKLLKEKGAESGYIYIEIGNIYFHLKLYNTAKKFYSRANALFKKENDLIGQSIVLDNYGSIHSRNKESDSALVKLNQALKLQLEVKDKFYAAQTQRALALEYSAMGDYEKAFGYLVPAKKAIHDERIKNHKRYAWDVQFIPQQVYLTLSDVYRSQQELDSAEYYLKKAIDATKIFGIEAHRVRYLTFLGNFYMEQKQYPKAQNVLEEAGSLADKINYVWGKVGVLQSWKNFYGQQKDAKHELQAAYEYLQYKDKMFNENNNDELIVMSNLVLQYENELEIERQQNLVREKESVNQLQRQLNYLLIVLLIIFLVALIAVVYLYRSLRVKNKLVEKYSKELESNNETMRMLLSVISHDLRSPFNSLLGLTKVTLMETTLEAGDYRQRFVMMHDTASKGAILLDNLLQWVAMQRDKTLLKEEEVRLPELVEETQQELANLALTQHVTIEKQILLPVYSTDRNAMKVIIRNLLTNAIKYSSGKKVMLAINRVENFVFIHVTDQGPGIPLDIMENLFEQGDMKKVVAKGGGLGMIIVKEFVNQLKGQIRAVNLPEGGARFEVRLPINK